MPGYGENNRWTPGPGDIPECHTDGFNVMRDALSWFDSHEVEKKLGHLPQWVPMAREVIERRRIKGG